MAKNTTPLEAWEQEQIITWARANQVRVPELQLLNASLCGVRLTPGLRMKMKRQGMPKGFPDINLPIRSGDFSGLYIELKRLKGGSVSPEQEWWIKRLRGEGYVALVVRGHEEAIEIIKNYINWRD